MNASQEQQESPDLMRRGDSDSSWHPSQEIQDPDATDDTAINKDQLFLVSLGALMSLFT